MKSTQSKWKETTRTESTAQERESRLAPGHKGTIL